MTGEQGFIAKIESWGLGLKIIYKHKFFCGGGFNNINDIL